MESIGNDVHKVNSQVCIVCENGEVIEERRIHTDRERFAAVLGKRPKARVLIEASTESEWVARCLEELGHEVIVADPNFAAMYATRSKRVKTDRRDARTLAEAGRLGAYRPAHRTSEEQRRVRAELAVREGLVRTRTRYISVVLTIAASPRRDPVAQRGLVDFRGAGGRAFASAVAAVRDCTAVGRDGEAQRRDPCCRRSARQASEVGCGGAWSLHGARRGGCDGDSFPSDTGRGGAFSRRASDAVLPRAGAAGDELGGKAAPRPDHEVGQRSSAMAAGGSGVGGVAVENGGDGAASRVGAADRSPAREARRHGRPGAQAGGNPICDVAGRELL
jgi:hypothetical protein